MQNNIDYMDDALMMVIDEQAEEKEKEKLEMSKMLGKRTIKLPFLSRFKKIK